MSKKLNCAICNTNYVTCLCESCNAYLCDEHQSPHSVIQKCRDCGKEFCKMMIRIKKEHNYCIYCFAQNSIDKINDRMDNLLSLQRTFVDIMDDFDKLATYNVTKYDEDLRLFVLESKLIYKQLKQLERKNTNMDQIIEEDKSHK
jgi:hypothetical protein